MAFLKTTIGFLWYGLGIFYLLRGVDLTTVLLCFVVGQLVWIEDVIERRR